MDISSISTTKQLFQLPHLSMAENQFKGGMSKVVYHRRFLTVRGWIYRPEGGRPDILVFSGSRRIRATILWEGRADIAIPLRIDPKEPIGFLVNVFYEDLSSLSLSLGFVYENGYLYTPVRKLKKMEAADHRMNPGARRFKKQYPHSYDDYYAEHFANVKRTHNDPGQADNGPRFTIVSAVSGAPENVLTDMVQSVLCQSYPGWELYLADDTCQDEQKRPLDEEFLSRLCEMDDASRIHCLHLEEGQDIVSQAAALSQGNYLFTMKESDLLSRDACAFLKEAIEKDHPDIVYTDEDHVTYDGRIHFDPKFKPDYSPEFLDSSNYIEHIFCVRKEIAKKVLQESGRWQMYDYTLRCCEQAENICHIPVPLYHIRELTGLNCDIMGRDKCHVASCSAMPDPCYVDEKDPEAIQQHLARLGYEAEVKPSSWPGIYCPSVKLKEEPLISIIIPNQNHRDYLEDLIDSIFEKSAYRHFEILVVENGSYEPDIFNYYETIEQKHENVRVLSWNKSFNYSAINNYAVRAARGSYLLFLNNDMRILSPDWMEGLLSFCQMKDVGACGAKLLYEAGAIQHGGVVIGLGGAAGHMFSKGSMVEPYYEGRALCVQNVSAVTGACLMTKKSLFERVGGFDENLKVACNDVDLCLKIIRDGYRIVMNPNVKILHLESQTRGQDIGDFQNYKRFVEECVKVEEKWPEYYEKGDPFYNPNLSLMNSFFLVRNASFEEKDILPKLEDIKKHDDYVPGEEEEEETEEE